MDNWKAIKEKYNAILKEGKLIPGGFYRAVTCDGDIYDGVLTYASRGKAELQIGSEFRSFNRDYTKLVKYAGE